MYTKCIGVYLNVVVVDGGGDSFSHCVGLKPRKNNKLNTKQEK